MLPYLLFVALLLFFYGRKNPMLMILTMGLFAVLRYDVGWDYVSYYELSSDPTALAIAQERYSALWYWLFETAYNLRMPHLAIAVPAIVTYAFIYKAVDMLFDKDKEHMCDALLVYGLWPFFYLGSFSTIRQNLAMAIVLFIFALLYCRRWLWAALLYVFNFVVHPSSLVAIVLLPLFFIKRKIKWYWVAVAMVALLFLVGNWIDVITAINIETFNEYAATYEDFEGEFGGTLSLLLGAIALFLAVVLIFDTKKSIWQYNVTCVVIMAFIATIYIYSSDIPVVVTRIISYFNILLILVFFAALRHIPQRHILRMGLTVLLVGLFFFYLQRTNVGAAQGLGTSGYLPYKTIINQR